MYSLAIVVTNNIHCKLFAAQALTLVYGHSLVVIPNPYWVKVIKLWCPLIISALLSSVFTHRHIAVSGLNNASCTEAWGIIIFRSGFLSFFLFPCNISYFDQPAIHFPSLIPRESNLGQDYQLPKQFTCSYSTCSTHFGHDGFAKIAGHRDISMMTLYQTNFTMVAKVQKKNKLCMMMIIIVKNQVKKKEQSTKVWNQNQHIPTIIIREQKIINLYDLKEELLNVQSLLAP